MLYQTFHDTGHGGNSTQLNRSQSCTEWQLRQKTTRLQWTSAWLTQRTGHYRLHYSHIDSVSIPSCLTCNYSTSIISSGSIATQVAGAASELSQFFTKIIQPGRNREHAVHKTITVKNVYVRVQVQHSMRLTRPENVKSLTSAACFVARD